MSTSRLARAALSFALVLSAAAPLFAQQFAHQAGVIPGPAVWTEGVVIFDADGDSDLDVVFTNGDGFSSAGTPRAPTILINNGVVGGNPSFADQSATRFPAFTQNGKGVIAFDAEGDGDKDLLFANGFNKQPRMLLNDGSGFFSDVSGVAFPAGSLNSFGANAGDVDNDGDLDVAMCHHGGTDLIGPGASVQLFENTGGSFANVTAGTVPANSKTSQQNVTFADVDNDFDLDMVVDGRSTPQQVFFNDGAGSYTLSTSTLPAGSSSVYETDHADLDGDGDLDTFFISLSGFNEGVARNNLVPSGTLTYTGSTAPILGGNGADDNEVVFLDYDVDGDLDPLVGSLGNNREKLYRNNGNFTFTLQTTAFTAITDPTLDVAVGDMDGDFDYDIVTAQGEGTPRDNRYYRNGGTPDTLAPTIVALRSPSGNIADFPFAVRAKASDSTMDDGDQFVDCAANFTITPPAGSPVSDSALMSYMGGLIFRTAFDGGLTTTNLIGAQVDWSVQATDWAGNVANSTTTSFIACGKEQYGIGAGGSNVLTLDLQGTMELGTNITMEISGGQPNAVGLLLIGTRGQFNALGGTAFVAPLVAVDIFVDGTGSLSIPTSVPNDVNIVGSVGNFQVVLADSNFGSGAALSNGLTIGVCPAP